MPETPIATVTEHFSGLEDSRGYNRRHLVLDIMVNAIYAPTCGADALTVVELFGEAKEEWFKGFLKLPHGARTYWGIENKVGWVLDIAFSEDDSRVRKVHGAQNFAAPRYIALNLARQESTGKISIPARRKKTGWDNAHLLKILTA